MIIFWESGNHFLCFTFTSILLKFVWMTLFMSTVGNCSAKRELDYSSVRIHNRKWIEFRELILENNGRIWNNHFVFRRPSISYAKQQATCVKCLDYIESFMKRSLSIEIFFIWNANDKQNGILWFLLRSTMPWSIISYSEQSKVNSMPFILIVCDNRMLKMIFSILVDFAVSYLFLKIWWKVSF